MSYAYDTQAPKRPTNVSINSDLLAKAKGFNINLSATLEHMPWLSSYEPNSAPNGCAKTLMLFRHTTSLSKPTAHSATV